MTQHIGENDREERGKRVGTGIQNQCKHYNLGLLETSSVMGLEQLCSM